MATALSTWTTKRQFHHASSYFERTKTLRTRWTTTSIMAHRNHLPWYMLWTWAPAALASHHCAWRNFWIWLAITKGSKHAQPTACWQCSRLRLLRTGKHLNSKLYSRTTDHSRLTNLLHGNSLRNNRSFCWRIYMRSRGGFRETTILARRDFEYRQSIGNDNVATWRLWSIPWASWVPLRAIHDSSWGPTRSWRTRRPILRLWNPQMSRSCSR